MFSESESDAESTISRVSDDRYDDHIEDYGDDQAYQKHYYDVDELLERADETIKEKKNYTQKSDVDEFFDKFGRIAGKASETSSENLLHLLVHAVKHRKGEIKPQDVELLLRRLVAQYPDLLRYANKDGQNPVYMSIRARNYRFIDYIVSTCEDPGEEAAGLKTHMQCLDDAIRMKGQGGKSSLHLALQEDFDSKTTRRLIKAASDETLAAQDDSGKTAMHYAVAYEQCTKKRTEIIKLFIQRDLQALQAAPSQTTFLDLFNSGGYSVYREHLRDKEVVLKSQARPETQGDRIEPPSEPQVGTAYDMDRPSSKDPMGPSGRTQANVPEIRQPGGLTNGRDTPNVELDEREEERRKKKAAEAQKRAAMRGSRRGMPARDANDYEDPSHRRRNEAAAKDPARPAVRSRREIDPSQRLRGNRIQDRVPIIGRDDDQDSRTGNDGPDLGLNTFGDVETEGPADPVPNSGIRRVNTGAGETESNRQRTDTNKPKSDGRKTSDLIKHNSKKILRSLKLHYMQTRDTEKAISFLYGRNMKHVYINFDYDKLPRKMRPKDFEMKFGADKENGLVFDEVLQYVFFPPVKVELTGPAQDKKMSLEPPYGEQGRDDMKYFFDWLYKKGVRYIIRVTLQDSGDSGEKVHSDYAIQQCLEKFIVESLDWQKTDLDPETIQLVGSKAEKSPTSKIGGSQLKELHLRWSGSNAVLRAWSEPDGLPVLPSLERIILSKPPREKTLDSSTWINKKIEDFQQRLNKSRAEVRAKSELEGTFGDIEVIEKETGTNRERKVESDGVVRPTPSAPIAHEWLESTTKFATVMKPFWQTTLEEFKKGNNKGTTERVEEDVVVALIDDGVDRFHPSLAENLLEGTSYDFHNSQVRPPYCSARGHGTDMARMISQVCPMAKIYPIRLKTWDVPDGKSRIDSAYAAKAIQAALDKKATIISMSWSLPMDKGEKKDKDELHRMLQKAVDSKVLMICSAPDKGKFTTYDYPSGPWPDEFLRIGAARADGTVFDWTSDNGIDFALPGVDVIKDQDGDSHSLRRSTLGEGGVTKRADKAEYETGSSVATALAAGLAAMLIYCVKASILSNMTANKDKGVVQGVAIDLNDAASIAKRDAMRNAFSRLGKVTDNQFIQVWDSLDDISLILGVMEKARQHGQELSPDKKSKYIAAFLKFSERLVKPLA